MWDFNRAERRALFSALFLIGLGLFARIALAPGPGDLEWLPANEHAQDLDGIEAEVAAALAREQRA